MRWITFESRAGEVIQAGNRRLTPFASLVRVQHPRWTGGLVWNRPSAVLVTEADGQEAVLRVSDVTRLAQLSILAVGLLTSGLIWLSFRNRKTK